MTDNIKLPPMPETEWKLHMPAQYYEHAWKSTESGYTEADMENYAREAVRLNAQAVPDGWKLAPVKATDEMCNPTGEISDIAAMAAGYRAEIWAEMLSLAPAAPQPAQQDAKPIYQYQLATGGWIDQTRDSYEYNKANGVKGLRIVYEAAPQPAQQPLTDERLQQMHHEDEFGLFCDYDDFEQIARAIEQAHGIGVKQ